MKILSILFLAASLFAFTGCADGDKANDTATDGTQPTGTSVSASPEVNAPAPGTNGVPANDPNMMQTQPQMQTAQPAQQPATDGSVALNPAHGQPGHRCDIAVGAPLNSAPAAQPQTIQVQ